MERPGKILVIDDDQDILLTARVVLKKQFGLIRTENNPASLRKHLDADYDVILLDMNFSTGATSGREGLEILRKIMHHDPEAHVVMMTAYGDIGLAVRAMQEGATDFIVKPWNNQKLLATILNAFRLHQSARKIRQLKEREMIRTRDLHQQHGELIGRSGNINAVLDTIRKVAPTDANVLILGENGTGKELIATEIHRQSGRASEVFVSVDLGAIPESLFESELFGHVKGAFTDASEDRSGRFEVASGGTLFLDEIGNLSLPLQAKLLTAVQHHSVTRVGSSHSLPVDIRLISATNMPLHQMVLEKTFREDLLYRINTVEIIVPPLRERIEDIPELADHFLQLFARKYNRRQIHFKPGVKEKLQQYSWPGNIRELQHVIERAVILGDSEALEAEDFLIRPETGALGTRENLKMEDVERYTVQRALEKHRFNISKAADALGMARTTLYRKMNRYGIS